MRNYSSVNTYSKSILVARTVANQVPKFRITNAKLYVPVVTLSTQGNIKLLKQLESGFKRTIIWNKHHSKKSSQVQNRYLNVLIDPRSQGVRRLFVLSFEVYDGWKNYKKYYLRTMKIKNCGVNDRSKEFLWSANKNDLKAYDNRKTSIGQEDDYRNRCLLDYRYFKKKKKN